MLTIRELLERIRPAGTPGPPTEGERRRRNDARAAEIADVVALLAEFEAEADAIVDAAEAAGRREQAEARRQAARIAASTPDRVATAGAGIAARNELERDAEVAAIRARAEQDAERLIGSSTKTIPVVAGRAVQMIWDSMTEVPAGTVAEERR